MEGNIRFAIFAQDHTLRRFLGGCCPVCGSFTCQDIFRCLFHSLCCEESVHRATPNNHRHIGVPKAIGVMAHGYSSASAGSAGSPGSDTHDQRSRWHKRPLPIRTVKMAADTAESDTSGSPPPASGSSKRKRQDLESGTELEVDVDAPEPPSKKALRKEKKSKTSSANAASTEQSTNEAPTADNSVLTQPEGEPSKSKTGTPRSEAIAATSFYRDGCPTDKVSKQRSEWSIWIGNLPHNKMADDLVRFFFPEDVGKYGHAHHALTRIYMPGPKIKSPTQPLIKNDGWAYVDFNQKDAYLKALGMSETLFSGRKVLIKDAKCYLGRPAKQQDSEEPVSAKPVSSSGNPPSRRIFVGNIGFDTTEQDVREHFTQIEYPKEVKLATFLDTGNCKGYGWIQFENIEAAEQAVRGWIEIKQEVDVNYNNEGVNHFADATKRNAESRAQRIKPRRLFLNKLHGQELRIEFAEDRKVRYKKRFGNLDYKSKGKPAQRTARRKEADTRGKKGDAPSKKVDARTIKPGAAHAAAPRLQGSIVAGQGKKTSLS